MTSGVEFENLNILGKGFLDSKLFAKEENYCAANAKARLLATKTVIGLSHMFETVNQLLGVLLRDHLM